MTGSGVIENEVEQDELRTIAFGLYIRLLKEKLHIKRIGKCWNWSSRSCVVYTSGHYSMNGRFLNRYYIGKR